MGLGQKVDSDAPNPSNIVNRDILQRLNFLYQASVYLESISRCGGSIDTGAGPPGSNPGPEAATAVGKAGQSTAPISKAEKRNRYREKRKGRVIRAADIGQGYVRAMKLIGQKTTVKMDPTVKRTLCKGCDTVLIPGLSATVRVNSSNTHRHVITTNCLRCNLARRIPAPPVLDSSSTSREDAAMEVDRSEGSFPPRPKRRRGPSPRLPPLFEREGHVIFRGNVQIEPKHT
ncbi:RNAse P Rpr2/Rpp21/SNM1 subunit domain-containing protein [Russula compacta]|nr:RNAse P Rpr2/Rpp21/SNM1 subunit domain-containing protein [Russula compacta]